MIKLAPLLKEIEVMRPFSGRITNVTELESYLNFLERKEGEEIYDEEEGLDKEGTIEDYDKYNIIIIPKNIRSLYNLRYVEGELTLSYSKNITSLPNNLTVTKNLYIDSSNISEIPNNLNIGWALYCIGTKFAKQHSAEEIKQMIIDKGGSVKKVYSKL